MQLRIHPKATLTPFAWYRTMRDNEPVAYDEVRRMWHVFRYDDAERVLSDHQLFSSDRTRLLQQRQEVSLQRFTSIIGIDPPRHHQLRSLVAQAFTPRVISQLAPRIREIAEDLIRAPLEHGVLEAVRDLAFPLPMMVIAQLLGVPVRDRDRLKTWADKMVAGNFAKIGEGAEERHLVAEELADYFRGFLAQRRLAPQQDLISNLLAAQIEDETLQEDEIIAFCMLLLLAGHETTTCLIGNALRCFDEQPELWATLKRQPELVPAAIDEVLRYYSPLKAVTRVTMADIVIGDQQITVGQPVCAWVGSANRDERQFASPDLVDLQREPTKHLAFGHGIHFCVGSALARLEAKIVLELLLERLERFACLDAEALEPLDSLMLYGVKRLPISFELRHAQPV